MTIANGAHRVCVVQPWLHHCRECRSLCLDLDEARRVLCPAGAPWGMREMSAFLARIACDAGMEVASFHVLSSRQFALAGPAVCVESMNRVCLPTGTVEDMHV